MDALRLNRMFSGLAARQDLILVGLLVLTTVMMILPMPTMFADILIATNIALSVMLMMVAIYINGSVEFSTLPTVILISTAFRLSLSITTSRMILVQGDAGDIIRTFGEFVIAGNIVVGLVVYLIITIVQFVVITKGSERVAEVAARFTLDALPGKQISIDTDLKQGDIDQPEARRRRQLLEKESQLYGAMDGAMKFVKGDAIASLVIIVVNLVGGMTIGALQRGLSFSDAVQTYSLLAVGDGLIAQIPALLISLTAGIIVTRVTSAIGGNLGRDMVGQLTADPRVLQVAAAVLAALAFVPGFPMPIFLTLAVLLGAGGWALSRQRHARTAAGAARSVREGPPEAAALVLRTTPRLSALQPALGAALLSVRAELSGQLGIVVPTIGLADADLGANDWRLEVDGLPIAAGTETGTEAGTGAGDDVVASVTRAVRVALAGIAGQFVGIQETQAMLTRLEPGYADLVREALKGAPLPRLAEVLRRLVGEGVPVANLRAILESVAEWGGREQNNALLAEHVRIALRRYLCHGLGGEARLLSVVIVDGALDQELQAAIQATANGLQLALDQAAAERLVAALRGLLDPLTQRGKRPAVLTSMELRRHLRSLLVRRGLAVAVLSHGELAPDYGVDVAAILRRADLDEPHQPALAA